jgi:type I restriction enzyme S subunit
MKGSEVQLQEVLQLIGRPERVDALKEYRLLGVRLDGGGPFLRETKLGSQSAATTLSQVCEGDFIYSRLFAWRGAFGVVGKDLRGCYVSNEFPTFEVDSSRLDSQFLNFWFKLKPTIDQVEEKCTGTTPLTRNRFKEQFLLAMKLPLPTLAEQRRIVLRIQAAILSLGNLEAMHRTVCDDIDILAERAGSCAVDDPKWERIPLGELLLESPRNGMAPKQPVSSGGRPMLRINAVSSSPTKFVDTRAVKLVSASTEESRGYETQDGDVFIVRYNGDINRVAKAALYRSLGDNSFIFPDKLMRLRVNSLRMTPEFLVSALGARSVREQVEAIGRTTAGNIGVSGSNAKLFIVPVPPLDDQAKIVATLDSLQMKLDELKCLRDRVASELGSLLPALLHCAFNGEL